MLVTRARGQSSALADQLRTLGAEPVLIPAIEIVAPSSFEALDQAILRLSSWPSSSSPENIFHWLIFTSANAVQAFAHRRMLHLRDGPIIDNAGEAPQTYPGIPRLAAIGPATAQALLNAGTASSPNDILVPSQAVAESLLAALRPYAVQPDGSETRFLLIRAEQARELLPEGLCAAGAEVTIAPSYQTVIPESSLTALRALFKTDAGLDAITFTSSSSVRNLLELCESAGVPLPASALRLSIGPITSQTLREAGLPPHAEAPEANVRSLAETAMRALLK